jgi:hypothetical protein
LAAIVQARDSRSISRYPRETNQLGANIMENIINFPTKSVRDWVLIERTMEEEFSRLGIPLLVQIRLIENMKSFYQVLDFEFNFNTQIAFPGTIPIDNVNAICSEVGEKIGALSSKQLQIFTNKLFFDRLYREIDICRKLDSWR